MINMNILYRVKIIKTNRTLLEHVDWIFFKQIKNPFLIMLLFEILKIKKKYLIFFFFKIL